MAATTAITKRGFSHHSHSHHQHQPKIVGEATWEKHNNARRVWLNRPQALNAVNLSMIRYLTEKYKNREDEKVVIMKGAGGKAFCAGGDIRAIYDSALTGKVLSSFFKEEYVLNHMIGSSPIPQVSLLNGITMGGGVGLSVHGKYRVAFENTLFAMPETAIGFFCDVGGSHFLPRLKLGAAQGKELGLFLALTGARLKGPDVALAGVATHFVPSSRAEELEEKISKISTPQELESVLADFSVKKEELHAKSELVPHLEDIQKAFSQKSVEEIFSQLEKQKSSSSGSWAEKNLTLLKAASPTSLKVVFQQIHRGGSLSLADCLKMEYRMALHFLKNKDFFEGVRALLVDKDKSPKWSPSKLEEVKEEEVEKYFLPLQDPAEELVLWDPKSKL